jgi:tetratricopeptide (TPR) repeat protein
VEGTYHLLQNYLTMTNRLDNQISQMQQSSAWANRLRGDLLAARDLWTDAAAKYRQALAQDPTQAGLNVSLGTVLLRGKKIGEAEAAFDAELRLDPKNEQALLGLAEVQLAKGAGRLALESFSKIWESFPPFLGQQPDFPSHLKSLLDPEKANKLAVDLETAPDTPSGHFILAGLYRVSGRDDKAEEQMAAIQGLLQVWEREPHRPERPGTAPELCREHQYAACVDLLQSQKLLSTPGNLLLGKGLLALGQDEGAADAFATTLDSERDNPEAIYSLVRAYLKLANDCLNRLGESSPDSWRVHELRGEYHKLRGVYDEAIKEYQTATALRPMEAELYEGLGDAYLLNASLEQAESELKKALQLDRTRARSYYLLGRVCLARHEAQESIPYFEKALRYDPELLDAHAHLGQAYMRLGQAAEAVPELERADSLDYYGDLHHLLYVAYSKLGKRELAQKALVRSRELRQNSAATYQARVEGALQEIRR